MNVVVLLTRRELTYDIAIMPLFTIFIIAVTYWYFRRLTNKISIDDSIMKIEQGKKAIKINWSDIDHIYVERKWGATRLKIKTNNTDVNLPRGSFNLPVGSGSDEGEKLLVRALKKISEFTNLKFNNNMKNIFNFWDKFDA